MTEYIWFKGGRPSKHTEDELGERPTKVFLGGGVVIKYWYSLNCDISAKSYSKHGKKHRDGNKPAFISYYNNGKVNYKIYYKNGIKYNPTT